MLIHSYSCNVYNVMCNGNVLNKTCSREWDTNYYKMANEKTKNEIERINIFKTVNNWNNKLWKLISILAKDVYIIAIKNCS
jgi:hypothetical protein